MPDYNPPRSQDFYFDIAAGNKPGMSIVHKFGRNEALGATLEPIATNGIYQMPTAAVSLEFVSNDAADALDDVGMHELTVVGLDANWEEQTVSTAAHATDGTVAVAISGTWLRVYRAFVSSSGTYPTSIAESHAGDITIRVASAGATYAVISDAPIGHGQTEISAYTVPSGKTAYVQSISVTTDFSPTNTPDLYFFQRPNANDVTSSYSGALRLVWLALQVEGIVDFRPLVPLGPFVGPCDLVMAGLSGAGAATAEADFEIVLVDD